MTRQRKPAAPKPNATVPHDGRREPIRRQRFQEPFVPSSKEEIGRLLKSFGWPLGGDQLELLWRYHRLLMDRNRQLNLTRIWNLEDVVLKHYVDCFLVDRMLDLPSPILDIGTGAGFPGIPLKIIRPDLHIILAEGVQKRVTFLKEAREELHCPDGLDIIGRNIDRQFFYPVRAVITRAVESSELTLKRVRNCLLKDGLVILMKGPNVDEEKALALKLFASQFHVEKDISYRLPSSTHGRRLLVFRRHEGGVEDPEQVLEETEEP